MFGPKVSVRKWLKHEKGLKTRGFDKNGPRLDMETSLQWQKTSIMTAGAKRHVTFCRMHVFFGRGVEGKGGKGDRVNSIPRGL